MTNIKEIDKKLGYPLAAVATLTGLTDNIKYIHTLQIKSSELPRYFRKTIDLSMCYAGFAQDFSFNQARGAGHAAFLSCAYDVVTDWGKPAHLQTTFAQILRSKASPELTSPALGLLDRDSKGALLDDGLERGATALEFVLQMMKVREIFDRKCSIQQLGTSLQIVDDVIDWESDVSKGDENCLTNVGLRETYLSRLQEDFDDSTVQRLFPYGAVLGLVIKHTKQKAADMLAFPEKYFEHIP